MNDEIIIFVACSWCWKACQRFYGSREEAPAIFHRATAWGSTDKGRNVAKGTAISIH